MNKPEEIAQKIRFGEFNVTYKVSDGKIVSIIVKPQTITLPFKNGIVGEFKITEEIKIE